jgi:hypothetical protein
LRPLFFLLHTDCSANSGKRHWRKMMSHTIFENVLKQTRDDRQKQALVEAGWKRQAEAIVGGLHRVLDTFEQALWEMKMDSGLTLGHMNPTGFRSSDGVNISYRLNGKHMALTVRVRPESMNNHLETLVCREGEGISSDDRAPARFNCGDTPETIWQFALSRLLPDLAVLEPVAEPGDGMDVKKRPMTLAFIRYSRAMVSTLCVLSVDTIYADELGVLDAIRRAVGVWIGTSEQGKAISQYAGDDLNIGDLDGHGAFSDQQFLLALQEQGVEYRGLNHPKLLSYDSPLAESTESGVDILDDSPAPPEAPPEGIPASSRQVPFSSLEPNTTFYSAAIKDEGKYPLLVKLNDREAEFVDNSRGYVFMPDDPVFVQI